MYKMRKEKKLNYIKCKNVLIPPILYTTDTVFQLLNKRWIYFFFLIF